MSSLLFLTKMTTPVIGWICDLLGWIMSLLFKFTSVFGISNIGLCIILFTVIVNVLMLPLTIKQQKSQKLMNFIQPEIKAIQKKYQGKTDQASAQRMQAETQAVYEKYGTSMTGGCVQLLIQLPILLCLYQVIYRIPAYIPEIKAVLEPVATSIMAQTGYIDKISDLASAVKLAVTSTDYTIVDKMIDFLYKLSAEQWGTLQGIFPNLPIITQNGTILGEMNSFLGIDLAANPWQGFKPNWAWLIPVLAGVTQWLSVKVMPQSSPSASSDANDTSSQVANSMKSMNVIMPVMSVVFCFTFPAGIGIYWIASAVVRTIIQLIIEIKYKDIDPDVLIEQNLAKINAKRAKKGLPPKTIDRNAMAQAERDARKAEHESLKEQARLEKSQEIVKESTDYYNFAANPGSLAAKANMVSMYNQKEYDKKRGRKTQTATEAETCEVKKDSGTAAENNTED